MYKKINGSLLSVNPIALHQFYNAFCENKREFTIVQSNTFGDVLFMEVGATNVGSIVQTFNMNQKVEKGDEKGFFQFGGSTIILFFQPETIKFDQDLLENTIQGYETLVKMGESLGRQKTI